jgi:hypothetical protein
LHPISEPDVDFELLFFESETFLTMVDDTKPFSRKASGRTLSYEWDDFSHARLG